MQSSRTQQARGDRTTAASYSFPTLPDYFRPHLRLVFVGINPSIYSVERGHYFARSTNRFWPAFSRSILSAPVRAALKRDELRPQDDRLLPRFGIGLTDLVKVPSANAASIRSHVFKTWAPRLLDRLSRWAPDTACFHGLMGYRAFARYALHLHGEDASLGAQRIKIGPTRLFVVPNPSPANAHFRPEDLTRWYDRLARAVE